MRPPTSIDTSRRNTRVVVCLGGDATRLEQRELPGPGPGELLLSLRAVGLCGTDLFKLANNAAHAGDVLGHELVGRVIARGDGVTAFDPGDRVAVPHHVPCGRCAACRADNETLCATFRENLMEPGGFSDLILVRKSAVTHAARKVPDSLADQVVVWMEPAACVLRGIRRAGLASGTRVPGTAVVLGAGSMGGLHLLVLKALRPELAVVMVDPEPDRRAMMDRLGANAAVAPEAASAAVQALSAGRGADAVFDTVGGAALLEQAITLSREGGSIVLFAHAPAGERASFDINNVFKYERRIIGSYSGTPTEQQQVFDLMGAGALDPSPLISHTFDLSRFEDAVELLKRRKAMKVVFTGAGVTR